VRFAWTCISLALQEIIQKNIFDKKTPVMNIRNTILIGLALCAIVGVFLLPPIAQDPLFHKFADNRTILTIPNFYNVISNLPFLILGIAGLYAFFKNNKLSTTSFAILTLFIGVIGIGAGSAYYHLNPNNTTLVWDRIPMTITFMSFFAIIIGNYVNERWNFILLLPMLIIGVVSVLTWYYGELNGHGDLRLYILVQFFPMLAIPLIIFMYPTPRIMRIEIITTIILYVIAKFFENKDVVIFNAGEILSGHTIKHLFAAAAVFYILQTVKRMSGTPVVVGSNR
jgi:hypothetical protein